MLRALCRGPGAGGKRHTQGGRANSWALAGGACRGTAYTRLHTAKVLGAQGPMVVLCVIR